MAEEDSTAADFMGVADQGFTGVEVSTPEATLPIAADTPTADIVAVTTEDGATTEVPALWLGRGLGDGRAGRYWGRGYGYGWGWGFGFGWPYWGWGYPYGYYYSPGYYAPYPYYSYLYYPDPNNGDDDLPPADPNARPQPNQNGPARPWSAPAPGGAAYAHYANSTSRRLRRRFSPLTGLA